jgi:hypothetical protein
MAPPVVPVEALLGEWVLVGMHLGWAGSGK